jgi:hypothetical protein
VASYDRIASRRTVSTAILSRSPPQCHRNLLVSRVALIACVVDVPDAGGPSRSWRWHTFLMDSMVVFSLGDPLPKICKSDMVRDILHLSVDRSDVNCGGWEGRSAPKTRECLVEYKPARRRDGISSERVNGGQGGVTMVTVTVVWSCRYCLLPR